MRDEAKTKAQLIRELAELRQRITKLEARETEHERVEEEIRQLKEFSESLIQNMAEGIALEDAEGHFTFVNRAAATLLGYTPEELLGQHWTVIVPPDQQSIVRAADERRVRGEADQYELELVSRGGTPLFVQVNGSPQFNATGRFIGTLAVFTDVTERKRAEEALQESEMRFRSIVQSAIDAVILIDSHGRIISWNKGAQLIFGYTEEEVMNKPLTLLMPERYREAHQSGLVRVNATGQSRFIGKTLELAGLRKDSQEFPLELSLATWQTKEEVFYSGIVRDITKRKRVEEALRESEERYHSLVEASPDVIVLTDLAATITLSNQQAVRLLGYEYAEEIIGKSAFDFIAPEDWPRATENMQRTLETGSVRDIEYTLLKKDGTRLPTELSASLIRNPEGKPKAFTGVLRDITARKQAEAALQQRNRELALLNRVSQAFNSSLDLDEVLVNILEEVRPLLGVVGASIWLNDNQTGELVCHQASGVHNEMLQGWRLQPGEGIAGWVAQHGQSQIVPDVQDDARHFKYIEQEIGLELHSILCVPLQSKLTVIGVLEVVDTTADRFNQTDLTLVESLAATATIAIENARLYEQTRGDAKISAVLLEEVNHRVKNNLAAIIGLLHLEQRHIEAESQTIDQTIMQDLINRIHGLATAHRLLSTANWSPILLSELTTKVIHSALQALPLDKYVSVEVSASSIQIVPKLANTLALVITELTTNTVKYAWPKAKTGHIAVRLDAKDDNVLLEFRDDGPGFPEEVLRLERHSVGWELIQTLVRHGLRGEITLHNDQGAVTTISFPPFI